MKNFRNLMLQLVASTALILSAPVCFSASGQPVQQYEIELIVFQNLVENDGGEIWPIDYSAWFEESDGPDAAKPGDRPAVTWIAESGYRLSPHFHALKKSRQYRPLLHVAWRQAVADRETALPVSIPIIGNDSANSAYVDGSIRVAVERYLHLYLDLRLHTAAIARDAAPGSYAMEMPEFRLTEHRRMRSKEIHYFDNPRFGALALITPYDAPAPEVQPDSDPQPQPAATAP